MGSHIGQQSTKNNFKELIFNFSSYFTQNILGCAEFITMSAPPDGQLSVRIIHSQLMQHVN